MEISILGSTGSIGSQTLDVIRNLNQNGYKIKVKALSANKNISLLRKQIDEFNPELVCVCDETFADELQKSLTDIEILKGQDGLIRIAREKVSILVNAIVGFSGLKPTLEAIYAKNNVALANKESLVIAGQIVMSAAKKNNVKIIPIDSEHSAIFQALQGNDANEIDKIYLTASGGPFHKYENFDNVTVSQTIAHPTWNMGPKISVDSATMINKGFEIIEAFWLFNVPLKNIKVLIHPQSLIHSMVQYKDGSIIAQLGPSDMRLPIQYALTFPSRVENNFERLNFEKSNILTFDVPNKSLIGMDLCCEALEIGGTMPAALCIANDFAVERFLRHEYSFTDIYKFIKYVMRAHQPIFDYGLEEIFELHDWIQNLSYEV